jgi:cysteine desulfurase
MTDTLYFDYAATTPLRPEVREAMLPYLDERFGNPSATYALARQARRALDEARRTVARALGCRANDVTFTSGGTESINAAIKGVAFAQQLANVGNHIVTSAVEHHAVQGANALSLNVDELGIDLLSLSSHKFSGPRGAGVLYLRRGTPFLAQQSGGGQERQRRAGTENVAAIVGTARALELAQHGRDAYTRTTLRLRERLLDGIFARLPDAQLNGHRERRLPNNVNVSFPGADARILLRLLDEHGIAASAGSACNEETLEPSHVLLAMDVPLQRAIGTLRFSLSPSTSEADVDRLLAVLPDVVARARTPAGVAG